MSALLGREPVTPGSFWTWRLGARETEESAAAYDTQMANVRLTMSRFLREPFDSFCQERLGSEPLLVQAAFDPAAVATIEDFGGHLSSTRPEFPRLRVTKQASITPPERYTTVTSTQSGALSRHIDAPALLDFFRAGHTIVMDAVDEWHPVVGGLCDVFQRAFRVPVSANVYLGCGDEPGFDFHWDDHEVFVLHLFGEKRWDLCPPNNGSPSRERAADAVRTTEVERSVTVSAGDLLYVPRGWWHRVVGAEGTAHCSISVPLPLGSALPRWLAEVVDADALRRPFVPTGPEQWAGDALDAIAGSGIAPAVLVETYRDYCDAVQRPRPSISLTAAMKRQMIDKTDAVVPTCVRLPRVLCAPSGKVAVGINASIWTFDVRVKPLLTHLLLALSPVEVDDDNYELVEELALEGLVRPASPSSVDDADRFMTVLTAR